MNRGLRDLQKLAHPSKNGDNHFDLRAIQNLYRVFGRYPLRKHVNGCPCCVSDVDKQALASKPPRLLPRAVLYDYAFQALTTWGEKDDFRHFLPRIFVLIFSDEALGMDEEIVFGKIPLAEWQNWPDEEQSAVRDYFRTGSTFRLHKCSPSIDPNSWLCGMGHAGEDLRPHLGIWAQSRASSAYEHLVNFIEWNLPNFVKRHRLTNEFWGGAPVAAQQVWDRLANSRTRGELEKIYFASESAEYSLALARVIERLEFISKA